MHLSVISGRRMEEKKEFSGAVDAYRFACQQDDPDDRYEGTLGLLRLHERGQVGTHPLKRLGIVMLVLTIIGGMALIIPALPTVEGARVDVVRLSFGVAATLSGLIWSALLLGAARVVRLVETMNLRQSAEREARIRGEVGQPVLRPLPAPDAQ
jgi:uncharacterized membrane protein YuzA (DUF378 family)